MDRIDILSQYFLLLSSIIIVLSFYFEIKEQMNETEVSSEMTTSKEKDSLIIITGIFLLVLAVSGNFIAETLGCKIQYHLTNNIILKNLIVIMVVYFSLGFSDQGNNSPATHFRRSILIWTFFLLFNKMHLLPTAVTFLILSTILVLKDYIEYFTNLDKDKFITTIETMRAIIKLLSYTMIVIIVIGFSMYFKSKYEEYYETFDISKFIFGKTKCANDEVSKSPHVARTGFALPGII